MTMPQTIPHLRLDSALDTANELIRLSSPGVVHETLRLPVAPRGFC